MVYTSLAVVAMAASAAIPPFGNLIHMHPHSRPDGRVQVTLSNTSRGFRDVKIDGRSYEVLSHHTLNVKAPVGTVVYADSRSPQHLRGSVMFAVTSEMNGKEFDLK